MRCPARPDAVIARVWGLLLALALVLGVADSSVQAQGMDHAGAATLAQSARLRLYSLTRVLDRRASPPSPAHRTSGAGRASFLP